jgi:hypothetical protein
MGSLPCFGETYVMSVEPVAIRPDRPTAPWALRAWELFVPRLPRSLTRLLGRLVLSLPRGSRARRWCVLTIADIGWDATARARFDLVLPLWDPACEWRWDAQLVGLGDELYRGHEGVKRSVDTWNQNWSEVSFTVREILDGGDTWVLRMTGRGRGARSGVPTEMDFSSVVRLDPLIISWHNLIDDADALREAGFVPDAAPAARA